MSTHVGGTCGHKYMRRMQVDITCLHLHWGVHVGIWRIEVDITCLL